MPAVRSNSVLRSPEHRSMSYSHSRHVSQAHPIIYSPSDPYSQGPASKQQLSPQSSMHPSPVKEESRNPPSLGPQVLVHSQHPHQPLNQPPMQKAPPPTVSKPIVEPRKSNLMSLLNDTPPEEPRRKKPHDPGLPSHSTTPQQSTAIAPPPPTSQPYSTSSSSSRRSVYEDPMATLPNYNRPSYAQQSALPPAGPNRSIDTTNEQHSAGARPGARDNWPQRPQFHHTQSHGSQSVSLPSSQPGPVQSTLNEPRIFGNPRSVFTQHNASQHNPSPPPHGYNNSPHLHSRTPSISGALGQANRHGIPPSTTAGQHAQPTNASSQILQPNPYAQVDPPGNSVPPQASRRMRPSAHLHASHMQRDVPGRNEHPQTPNANLPYSNPQTPNEHPGHTKLGGPRALHEPYRPRDHRELDLRNSDRDTGRELAQRTDYIREQLSNPALRSTGPPIHEDLRYQPQDRGYLPQRSQTPLSRPEHGQTPQLQHPPQSSLGVANHSLYGQRAPEEPAHRFSQPSYTRERNIVDRVREEQVQQAQQHAAMNREERMRREREHSIHEREMLDREMRERDYQDARIRESVLSREMRAIPPLGSGPEQRPDQRASLSGPPQVDWNRHAHDRASWQR